MMLVNYQIRLLKNSDGTFKIDVQNLEQFCKDIDMSRSAVVDLFLAMTEAEGIDINFDNMSESIVDGLNWLLIRNQLMQEQI